MSRIAQVRNAPAKPVVVWDGDCNFCRFWILKLRNRTGDRVEYLEFQNPKTSEQFPEIPKEQFQTAVQLILPDGRVYEAAKAFFLTLKDGADIHWPLWAYESLPGAAPISESFYKFVASHRAFFSRLTRFGWGKTPEPADYRWVRFFFLRALALIYLAAFASLGTQIVGLAGHNGISAAGEFMSNVRQYAGQQHIGVGRYFLVPTLCWLDASDTCLRWLCIAGIILAAILLTGLFSQVCLILLWLSYLSLTTVCGVFLQFQWDNLLLETGLLAIFFAPGNLISRPWKEAPPSGLILWLLRWLLFRLMFQSGCVKLLSGDTLWRKLTALQVHYETQPLPTWIGWYAHQLPSWFQKTSCALMFFIEIAIPFLIFLPRRIRFWSFWPFVGLQLFIMLTGNYCFFNWLALALCLLLLDDAALRKLSGPLRRFIGRKDTVFPCAKPFVIARLLRIALAVLILVITAFELCFMFKRAKPWPASFVKLYQAVAPFRSINSYGLFAVMTPSRPEIIVEGSNDGQTWKAYKFKYKPQELSEPPRFVAPHQPRLDWQMWFAALGSYRQNQWFINFCICLLQGKREVLALLQTNPFPDHPPKYIRATTYDYRFTDFQTRRAQNTWWRRELKEEYLPPISLREGYH